MKTGASTRPSAMPTPLPHPGCSVRGAADLSDPRLTPRVMVGEGAGPVAGWGEGSDSSLLIAGFLKARIPSPLECDPAPWPHPLPDCSAQRHRQQQLTAYMAWVNSQLKKKPGTHLIEDLRNDMRDGVIFADIIEIVSQYKIKGIHLVPATYEEMRQNIDMVLQFMTQNRIKMHRISSRDIVEGNLKAVMRLILALAAHYKPTSVRHSSASSTPTSGRSFKAQSVMDIAQGASAALTEARRNAKKAGKRHSRSRHDRYHESSSEPCSDSDQSYLRPDWRRSGMGMGVGVLREERRELEGCSAGSSPVSSCRVSPRTSLQFTDDSPAWEHGRDGDSMSVDSGTEEVKDMKKQLLQLQDLILANSPDSAVEVDGDGGPAEGVVLLRSQVQHSSLLNEQLREEVSRFRNECLHLQGTKAGLQQRLTEQDAVLSQLKTDKLSLEIELQTVTAENVSLHKELTEQVNSIKNDLGREVEIRDQTVNNLRRELMRRDQMIDKLQQELKRQSRGNGQLTTSSATHKSSAARAASGSQDRGRELGGKTESPNGKNASQLWRRQLSGEVSSLQASLNQMQTLLSGPAPSPGHAPSPPGLDQLERQVISMLQNLRTLGHAPLRTAHLKDVGEGRKDNTPVPKLKPSAAHVSRQGVGSGGQSGDGPATSVLFFTDHAIQPATCLLPGKLGEIKLRDFKNMFEDCERYRYYFKALDPEYGTVKEELTREDAVVPGWEDKIVAWVETESGTPC